MEDGVLIDDDAPVGVGVELGLRDGSLEKFNGRRRPSIRAQGFKGGAGAGGGKPFCKIIHFGL